MIEVITVMLVLLVLAAISYPKLQDLNSMRLGGAAKLVAQQIRYAQWLAMTTGTTHGVYFNTGQNSYSIFRSNINYIVDDPHSKGRPFTVNLSGEENFRGVTITSVNFGGAGKPSVKFNSLGTPQDSSGTALTSAGRVILGCAGTADTVLVAATTGKATY
ncbi:MAG: hypothetical protein QME66_05345 [Candidatus Eisenbacteria bacterium]|nr:hypothetical protein [Candidatus Eisenbacteria bacterium]